MIAKRIKFWQKTKLEYLEEFFEDREAMALDTTATALALFPALLSKDITLLIQT